MQTMAEDHLRSQEALIAWTQDCVAGLMAQNAELSRKLEETNKHMSDLSYNIQGFVDADHAADAKVVLPQFDDTPPGLFQTNTPKVVKDPLTELGDVEDTSTLFATATGAVVEPSFRERSENARQGGPVTLNARKAEDKPAGRKSEEQKAAVTANYMAVKKYTAPKDAKGRWKWAFRKVLLKVRTASLKVAFSRGKVPENDTLFARLKRAELELFYQPIRMVEHVTKEATKINVRMDNEVKTLNAELGEQKEEYTAMGAALQTNIDAANTHITEVEKQLTELKEKVDSGNKALDDIEAKLFKVIARAAETEQALFNSLRGRIQEASEKTDSLLLAAGTIKALTEDLSKEVEIMSVPEEYETDAVRFDKESKKLFTMLQYETGKRVARGEVALMDTNGFSLAEILRQVRRDLLALSTLAGGDYEAIIPKHTVNELLAFIDSAHASLDTVSETVVDANSLWSSHDSILGSKWDVLAGMAEAVKNVAGIADVIDTLTKDVANKTDAEQVTGICTDVVTAAVQPVIGSVAELDKRDTAAIKETNANVTTIDTALKASLEKVNETLTAKIKEVENAVSGANHRLDQFSNASAADASRPSSSSGAITNVNNTNVNNSTTVMSLNLADIEQDLEPMIKNIVEAYVINNPSMSMSRGRAGGPMGGYFAPEIPPSLEDGSFIFDHHELEMVFDTAEGQESPEGFSDELDEPAKELQMGSLVKVVLEGHEHHMATGIVVGVVEESEHATEGKDGEAAAETDAPMDESKTEGDVDDSASASANQKESEIGSPHSLKKNPIKYRIAITPKTPITPGMGQGGNAFEGGDLEFDSFQSVSMDDNGGHKAARGNSGGGGGGRGGGGSKDMQDVQEQIRRMSRKIEDIVAGKLGGGGSARTDSPTNIGRSIGRGSPSQNMSSSTVSDTQIVELVQESMKAVAAEIGDLRDSSNRNLDLVRKQLKAAILHAINKAIVEQAEKDKPSMLTTKSLCMGCGRSALVRGQPFDQSLVSKGFDPALNKVILDGPDIMRGGFRMPVSQTQKLGKLAHPTVGMADESLFDEESMAAGGTHTTYSEILANLPMGANSNVDVGHGPGVSNVTDIGPGGMSISITSTTAPVRLSSTAKSIRHAQGKEEAAMLRPIHRKGMNGKVSENARKFVGKSWAPERFGGEINLSPNAQSIKIPSIARAEMARMSMSANQTGVAGGLDQASVDSKFHP